MGSKIALKNAQDQEFSINHNDNAGAISINSSDISLKSQTESEIAPYNKGFKNQIINGSFDIWQRGANIVANSTTSLYTADMWLAAQFGAGGIQTISVNSANLPNKNARSLKSLQTTACANRIVQILENDNSYKIRGNKLTISFWYKAKGTFYAKFNERTDQQTLSTHFGTTPPVFVGSTIGSFTGIADETWRYCQFTTNTTNSNGYFHLIFEQVPGINNYFEITEVQLEEGSVATPFENRPIGLEVSLCQRYYQIVRQRIIQSQTTGEYTSISTTLPVPMRIAPIVMEQQVLTSVNVATNTIAVSDSYNFSRQVIAAGNNVTDSDIIYKLSAEL